MPTKPTTSQQRQLILDFVKIARSLGAMDIAVRLPRSDRLIATSAAHQIRGDRALADYHDELGNRVSLDMDGVVRQYLKGEKPRAATPSPAVSVVLRTWDNELGGWQRQSITDCVVDGLDAEQLRNAATLEEIAEAYVLARHPTLRLGDYGIDIRLG
jgi:hypothetical protein